MNQSRRPEGHDEAGAGAASLDEANCTGCGYSLRGLPESSERCPECGESLTAIRAQSATLPWARARGVFGSYRAYWRTVLLVLVQGRRFRAELARPVDYGKAQGFRFLTVAHALAAPPAMLALLQVVEAEPIGDSVRGISPAIALTAYACIALFLLAATGIPSYFFHPRCLPLGRQNRGIALSYYACAPLAALPLSVIVSAMLFGLAWVFRIDPGGRRDWAELLSETLSLVALIGVPLAVMLLWWLSVLNLGKAALQSAPRVAQMALLIPMIWVLLALFMAVVVPISVVYGLAIRDALR